MICNDQSSTYPCKHVGLPQTGWALVSGSWSYRCLNYFQHARKWVLTRTYCMFSWSSRSLFMIRDALPNLQAKSAYQFLLFVCASSIPFQSQRHICTQQHPHRPELPEMTWKNKPEYMARKEFKNILSHKKVTWKRKHKGRQYNYYGVFISTSYEWPLNLDDPGCSLILLFFQF